MDIEELEIWRTTIAHLLDCPIVLLLYFLGSLLVFFVMRNIAMSRTPFIRPRRLSHAPSDVKPPSFPLRQLPNVALQEVLKHLDFLERIELSLCSKKCIQLVKIARRDQKFGLEVFHNRCLQMTFATEHSKDLNLFIYEKRDEQKGTDLYDGTINGHKFKFCRLPGHDFAVFWVDGMIGKVEILKYITDLFEYPRLQVELIDDLLPIRPVYEWIAEKYAERVEDWCIFKNERSPENWEYLSQICRKGECIEYPINSKRHRFELDFETNRLLVRNVTWMNLDDMIKLSSQSILLHFDNTTLTSEDVNGFLKNWIKTSHSTKMRYIFMSGGDNYNYDIDVILSGIDYKPRDALPENPFRDIDNFHYLRTKVGYTIQRNNGELASIFFSLEFSTSFEMVLH
ncbi:unnamed protein product [Caenorhabditis brenneri]